jgi:hypothetical protein
MHLGRRLGVGREQELESDPVDLQALARVGDLLGRGDQLDPAEGGSQPEARADLALRRRLQQRAEHVEGAPRHRVARDHVLRHRGLQETRGGDHPHPAGPHVILVDHAAHAAEVIDVAVRVDHGGHRPALAVRAVEVERGAGGLGADQRIDDDQAVVALDDRHVRDVLVSHLVDAVGDLEQPALEHQLRLAPEARVDRVGRPRALLDEGEALRVPEGPSVLIAQHAAVGERGDQPALGVVEILGVRERQPLEHGGLSLAREARGLPRFRHPGPPLSIVPARSTSHTNATPGR